MEFDYVVSWYSRKTNQVKPLGGFLDIQSAKEFSDFSLDTLFLGEGFQFINAPEGIYIKGYENYSDVKPKWFSPEESSKKNVLVFSNRENRKMRLDDFIPYEDYKKFKENRNMFQKLEPVSKSSVRSQLAHNKEIIAHAGKNVQPQQKSNEKQHDNAVVR